MPFCTNGMVKPVACINPRFMLGKVVAGELLIGSEERSFAMHPTTTTTEQASKQARLRDHSMTLKGLESGRSQQEDPAL